MNLADFLLARIADDADLARHPHAARAVHTIGCAIHPQGFEDTWCDCDAQARVLAECEAKRRITAEHAATTGRDGEVICARCADFIDPAASYPEANTVAWPCLTLMALALPYADHPDYDEAWRA